MHGHNCSNCGQSRWVIGDTGILICTRCDMGPLGIPRGDELRKP